MAADTGGDELLAALAGAVSARAPSAGDVRLVALDGYAGAGKTTLAAGLAATLGGAPIVATDDFACFDDFLGWAARLRSGVVAAFRAGRPASYPVYDWRRARFGPPATVPPAPVVLLEGVGAARGELDADLAFRVWVRAPRAVALRRARRRDGPGLDAFWRRWAAAEDAHFAADRPWERADAVVDTAGEPPRLILAAPR